jgi:hypothetical protein
METSGLHFVSCFSCIVVFGAHFPQIPSPKRMRALGKWQDRDLIDWLTSISMEKYAAAFIERKLNGLDVRKLQVVDLISLGVNSTHDQHAILDSAKRLKMVCPIR